MAVGKKITELNKEVKSNLSSDGTLVYVVNNNVSRQVDLDNLLFDGIITSSKIAANAIISNKIATNAIISNKIATNAIISNKIAANAITADKIAANAITADKIAANAITVDKITTATIEAIKISAADIDVNSIIAQVISSLVINGNQIFANSITADQIAANSITANQIAANSITTDTLAANSITTDKLAANSITTDTLQANSVTAKVISNGSISSESMFAANVITGASISSNSILAATFQSPNFNGSYNENSGIFLTGTEGFYFHGPTGTAVLNTLIARDDIITGNYIKYTQNGGFNVENDGSIGLKVDNDTISLINGSLQIKSVPSTAIVLATSDVNYTGAHNGRIITNSLPEVPVYGFQIFGVDGEVRGPNSGIYNHYNTNGEVPFQSPSIFVYDALENFDSALNITAIELFNVGLAVDYSNVGNLAVAKSIIIGIRSFWSDSATAPVNMPTSGSNNLLQIQSPVLPLAEVEYTASKILLTANAVATNRYLHLLVSVSFAPDHPQEFTGTLGVRFIPKTDSRLIVTGSGTITNPNNNFSDLLGTFYAR